MIRSTQLKYITKWYAQNHNDQKLTISCKNNLYSIFVMALNLAFISFCFPGAGTSVCTEKSRPKSNRCWGDFEKSWKTTKKTWTTMGEKRRKIPTIKTIKKFAKFGDAIAISKSETINHWLTHWPTDWQG